MDQHPTRFWVIVIVLGFVFDFLFWGQAFGSNFAIFTTLASAGGVFLLVSSGIKPARQALGLGVLFLFFNGMTLFRQEPLSMFLGVLTVTYSKGQWMRYSLLDYFYQLLRLVESALAAPILFITRLRKEQVGGSAPAKKTLFWRIPPRPSGHKSNRAWRGPGSGFSFLAG